ncbi:putative retrotransposable element tf2 155 kda protein type 1-like [Lyophyllum shimeji]|uniref:Retrotransposable element tf2 155 kDa protein type 1-like n=1 Tax=Lyophyllum shimeji TaxID=47721 RepID=A0A9P3UMN7_LYOSH|nr:putative retrotransposable element tf2 155 kda protein type 1-like [Lyophyllum shimeji]
MYSTPAGLQDSGGLPTPPDLDPRLLPRPIGPRVLANRCATSGRPQLYSFYRYYTVPQATGSIVHTVRALGKGSLDLFSLDLPLPASCEPASVQGSLLQIQDYRALNAVTVKNRYLLPLISELINNLCGAQYFTKLDVRWGYNNVRIKEGDEWKAAFRTNRGLFEPLVMFFGLTNSLATFQTMMNDIFRDLITQGVVCVYLDDILIYMKTLEEHRRITHIVLDRLREHCLFLKPEKCEFERTEIEYLRLIARNGVDGSGEGRRSCGRRFIRDFSHHARPLFDLTAKDVAWTRGSAQQDAFDALKRAITSQSILIFPDDDRPFRVEADSSDFATGTVLSQQSLEDEKGHPVAFYFKSLNAVERNYEIYDKEMLTIICALEEWRHFLEAPEYKPGDRVYLDALNIETTHPAKKLSHHYFGPYTVKHQVGPVAYKLRLSRSMSRLHPVFNAVKLRLAPPDPIPDRHARPPPSPTLINNEEWFDVEDILDSRFFHRKLQYKVKWKGYGYEDAS